MVRRQRLGEAGAVVHEATAAAVTGEINLKVGGVVPMLPLTYPVSLTAKSTVSLLNS